MRGSSLLYRIDGELSVQAMRRHLHLVVHICSGARRPAESIEGIRVGIKTAQEHLTLHFV